MRAAEGAACVGPTASVPGVAAAPAPAVAALFGVRQGRESGFCGSGRARV